ncbi:DUF2846 domain-containing protein [Pelomonas cellulosilytica]|uniref:DUF2846 domain-containing protein n=1 Tax=Pelomonas cellulosilytica TaxID=2906762 RepID=A0ABS8XSA1_9BURK|nr:DUF2846 domain-containing protein [Pelomonas sp. P8]MCE4555596.1 DUF2846 domain-containing protein [Pelomonas sp. P8]
MNRRTIVRAASILAFSFVSGCASNIPPRDAPKFSEAPAAPPGLATLYIFRPFLSENGSGVWPVTSLNGTKVADVKVGSYTFLYVKPGTYKITSEKSQALTFLDNIPGQFTIGEPGAYYLAFITTGRNSVVTVGTSAMTVAGPTDHSWRLLPRQEAMRFLPNMRFLPPYTQSLGN